ncbi:MAG: endonuclease domain-containing protein [Chloroflexi bacterium]|nr:MAG: endonuclease domain-containing protein [Chloroflexota bacterium]
MPPKRATPKAYERARALRKALTPAERKLWARLRNRQLNGVRFRRQHAIGEYIPDFVAIKPKLIVELDGSQHLEQTEYDEERTQHFELQGYRVIRFWNNDVEKKMESVILAIIHALTPTPPINGRPPNSEEHGI